MERRKTRLLFVIGHLVQSGAERFTYEVLKAIDRDRFAVELLTKRRIGPADYYYDKIRELGIPIHRKLPLLLGRLRRHARPLFLRTRWLLETMHRWYARLTMGDLLDRFDVINVVQIENYYLLQPLLKNNDRVLVYLMSHRFQYPFDPYADCDPDRSYRFMLYDSSLRDEYSTALPQGAEEISFPLATDLRGTTDLSSCARIREPFTIGVFVRLAADRPLTGIFEAFAKLRQNVPARLWMYGRGNPARLTRELDELGIREDVAFKGHTSDIARTLRDDGLSLVWMTSYGHLISYSSIEVASHGFPILFWNQHGTMSADEVRSRTGGVIEAYFDPAVLAEATRRSLQAPDELRRKGQALRAYVLRENDISAHIELLQEELERVAIRSRKPDTGARLGSMKA